MGSQVLWSGTSENHLIGLVRLLSGQTANQTTAPLPLSECLRGIPEEYIAAACAAAGDLVLRPFLASFSCGVLLVRGIHTQQVRSSFHFLLNSQQRLRDAINMPRFPFPSS